MPARSVPATSLLAALIRSSWCPRRAAQICDNVPMSKFSTDYHRALEVLADCPDGCPVAMMIAQGFTVETLCALVGAGLATAKPVRMVAGGRPVRAARVYVTEAGQAELDR